MYYIYKHTNLINGKVYIGQTCQSPPEERWKYPLHAYATNTHFINAIKEVGWDNFRHDILEQLDTMDENYATEREQYWMDKFDAQNQNKGYNIRNAGNKGALSDETKKKISKAQMGENNSRYGCHLSEETKQRISNSEKGKIVSEETKQKIKDNQYKNKKVRCIETGIVYLSLSAAARAVGLKRGCHIAEVCNGILKTSGGYHWEWISEVEYESN